MTLFTLVGIFRFNLMMVIVFYYLKLVAENIYSRDFYNWFKWSLILIYFVFMLTSIYSAITIHVEIDDHRLEFGQLCISWHYQSLKWGELFCSIIFYIVAVLIQIKVEEEFKKKLLKVNFDQIIFKERFASEVTPGGSTAEDNTMDSG